VRLHSGAKLLKPTHWLAEWPEGMGRFTNATFYL